MLKKMLFCCIIVCSILSCKKDNLHKTFTEIKTAPGPEDILLDKINNRILVSCNERRIGKQAVGEIYSIDLSTDESKILPRINFPSIPFNPHGFDLQTINGINYLYVINHYKNPQHTNSVIKFKILNEQLEFIREYKNDLLISPNDITVQKDGSFYFSNDRNSDDILELLTNPKAGSIVYCDGNNVWKKTDSLIGFPNGLFNEDGILYLATSRNYAMYKYNINLDGSLQNRKKISSINGMDNITENGDDLIISVHPDEIKFALLSYFPNGISPSRTYAINKQTGNATVIFNDDGKIISGSSTAIVYNNSLYLAQVFGDYILKITNYQD